MDFTLRLLVVVYTWRKEYTVRIVSARKANPKERSIHEKSYDFSDGVRGPVVPPDSAKTRITIRIDNDILDWFRARVNDQGGGNYQIMINQALRSCMREEKPLKELIQEALREELSHLKLAV